MKAGIFMALALVACAPPQIIKPAAPRPPTTTVAPKPTVPLLPAPDPGSAILYGDSLAVEVTQYIDAPIVELVRGGSAPCDWTAQMEADRASTPAKVIVAFSGNMATACTYVVAPGRRPLSSAQVAGRSWGQVA